MNKKIAGNISWIIGGKLINMLLQFIVSLATARYLGPSNLGIINYVAAYVSFFSSIASLGLAVVDIKEIAEGEKNANDVVWTSIWMRLAVAVLSSMCIILLMYFTNKDNDLIIIIALLQSISIVFSAFDTINYYFEAKLLAKWESIAGIISYCGMSIFRIILLIKNANIFWFAFATSVDMIILTIALFVFYIKQEGFSPCFNVELGKALFQQSYHYMIAGLITIIYSQIDKVMLANMVDETAVGLYTAALTVSTSWSVVSSALTRSISPILYKKAKQDRQLYLRRMRQSYAIVFWLNAAIAIVCTIFAKEIILILFGREYVNATGALKIVAWYYGISSMSALNQVYLANSNQGHYINKFCLGGLIVDISLNLILIPSFGIEGAAIATLITQITIQIIMPLMFRETREITKLIVGGIFLKDVVNKKEWERIKKVKLNGN